MADATPTTRAKQSVARDFFVYLTATIAMYVSVIALVTLWFEYINQLFPDALSYWYDPYQGPARFAIATLLVVAPLYLYFTRKINRDMRADMTRVELPVRRWLLYLTLFIGGLTLVIDLIVLINTFLGGEEITTAFLLKVLAVLAIVGGAFWYYLQDLSNRWAKEERRSIALGWGAGAFVAFSIVAGLFIMGSPATMRQMRFDQERVFSLQTIQTQITNFYQAKERLPETLGELSDPLSGFVPQNDPQTNEPFLYEKTGELSFRLCATFNRKSMLVENGRSQYQMGLPPEIWAHEAGRHCYERTVDPDRYPPFSAPAKPLLPISEPIR